MNMNVNYPSQGPVAKIELSSGMPTNPALCNRSTIDAGDISIFHGANANVERIDSGTRHLCVDRINPSGCGEVSTMNERQSSASNMIVGERLQVVGVARFDWRNAQKPKRPHMTPAECGALDPRINPDMWAVKRCTVAQNGPISKRASTNISETGRFEISTRS
jgi:hypothetical protein